ncbi:MAG: hypothetical protein EXX96DRAFT_477108 [Benjaminiella poitrasii]|nr:MAG: hypothetical protein EXX96DRAFT_477108 [Benjaminiella poitrasii]
MESDEEDLDCPLCMEEFDIADRNFKPCPCGYQICRFCWHHIRENLNGRCPACRREYSDEMVEFKPVSADELQRIRKEKKEKERQQKDMESANRRHLSNMRVVQKNLVYIIGLHPRLAIEEIVRSNDYFGQFGKISKVVINKRPALPASQISSQPSAAVYVTYYRKEDAAKAIAAVDGSVIADRVVRASYGTTKYCTYYLRNMTCPNPNCLYLHEQGEDIDTISKEELATGTHHMRDMLSNEDDQEKSDHSSSRQASPKQQRPQLTSEDFPAVSASIKHMIKTNDDSALPASASWAKVGGTGSTPSTPVMSVSDAFGPTLSAAVAATQQKTQFPPMPKRKSEKKKRKEQQLQQQQQKALSETSSAALDEEKEPASVLQREEVTPPSIFDQGLTGFVLGQAYREACPLPSEIINADNKEENQAAEDDDLTLGISALKLDDPNIVATEPSPAQRNLEVIQSASTSKLIPSTFPTVIDFLTYSTPAPKYNGFFNPFSHMAMTGQQHPNNNAALLLNNTIDSPVRRYSRFGFAQA